MKKIVRLTESDLTKIIKRVIEENKNSIDIFNILEKSNLYKILNNLTDVKYTEGKYPNNDRGGLRLLIYNDNGEAEYDFSINGYNVGNVREFLHSLIETDYLNGQTLKELKSIERKTSYGLHQLIDFIITDILNREPIINSGKPIRENEEEQITDEVTKTILDNISKEDLLTLGRLYNSIGEDEFKEVAEDVVDSVVNDESISESIGLSKRGFTYDSNTEKNKLEVAKIITRLSSTILAIMTGSIFLGAYRSEDFESSMVAGIITSAMIGANLLTRIPHNLKVEPLPEKLRGSRIEKIVDSEMKKIYSKKKDLHDFISHFESLGIPEKISTKFISSWAEKNNISFEEKRNIPRVK